MEITANALQSVNTGSNVVFTNTAVDGTTCIQHREGSGLVTLRGLTSQQRARFKISFGCNLALPTGSTVSTPMSLAIAINGEAVPTSSMISTPSTVGDFNNVYASLFIDVPRDCCSQISIQNTGTIAIDVQNANLIVERVA